MRKSVVDRIISEHPTVSIQGNRLVQGHTSPIVNPNLYVLVASNEDEIHLQDYVVSICPLTEATGRMPWYIQNDNGQGFQIIFTGTLQVGEVFHFRWEIRKSFNTQTS